MIESGKTKKQIVKNMLLKYHNILNRKQLLDKIVEDLLISENSARTHLSWALKDVASQIDKKYVTRNRDKDKLKKEKAFNIFVQNPNLSRKEMINLFESKLNMSNNSAATHCSMCVKQYIEKFNNKNHKVINSA